MRPQDPKEKTSGRDCQTQFIRSKHWSCRSVCAIASGTHRIRTEDGGRRGAGWQEPNNADFGDEIRVNVAQSQFLIHTMTEPSSWGARRLNTHVRQVSAKHKCMHCDHERASKATKCLKASAIKARRSYTVPKHRHRLCNAPNTTQKNKAQNPNRSHLVWPEKTTHQTESANAFKGGILDRKW